MAKQKKITTNAELVEAIRAIVFYNWQDEEEDYEENGGSSHIFHVLRALDEWAGGE